MLFNSKHYIDNYRQDLPSTFNWYSRKIIRDPTKLYYNPNLSVNNEIDELRINNFVKEPARPRQVKNVDDLEKERLERYGLKTDISPGLDKLIKKLSDTPLSFDKIDPNTGQVITDPLTGLPQRQTMSVSQVLNNVNTTLSALHSLNQNINNLSGSIPIELQQISQLLLLNAMQPGQVLTQQQAVIIMGNRQFQENIQTVGDTLGESNADSNDIFSNRDLQLSIFRELGYDRYIDFMRQIRRDVEENEIRRYNTEDIVRELEEEEEKSGISSRGSLISPKKQPLEEAAEATRGLTELIESQAAALSPLPPLSERSSESDEEFKSPELASVSQENKEGAPKSPIIQQIIKEDVTSLAGPDSGLPLNPQFISDQYLSIIQDKKLINGKQPFIVEHYKKFISNDNRLASSFNKSKGNGFIGDKTLYDYIIQKKTHKIIVTSKTNFRLIKAGSKDDNEDKIFASLTNPKQEGKGVGKVVGHTLQGLAIAGALGDLKDPKVLLGAAVLGGLGTALTRLG